MCRVTEIEYERALSFFHHFFITAKEATNVFLIINYTTPRVSSREITRAFMNTRNELYHANIQLPRFQGPTTLTTRLANIMGSSYALLLSNNAVDETAGFLSAAAGFH